tara:strand:+ start:616 stop:1233 length:618 start_codon:yes stop_codon:yes gene_type:complete
MEFYDWLIAREKSVRTAGNYSGAMSGKLLDHTKRIESPLFDNEQLSTDALFKTYCEKYDQTKDLYAANKRGKDMYRCALVMYSEYQIAMSAARLFHDFDKKVSASQKDKKENRRARLKKANVKPKKSTTSIEVFDRNPDVVAEVLFRANGDCESCQNPAPFIRKSDNTPYLEVHHRIPLAKGGDDTVENAQALCPNCHREKHYGV